ncbi:MAG TPA: hypothetical protein VF181_09890 [Balneolaceae bacterium]
MRLLGKINFTFVMAFLGLVFVASPAVAQDCEFDNWDVNNDDYLDEEEFYDAYDEVGYYDEWDSDDDDSLSETEWEMAADEHLGAYDSGKFSDWDTDGNGMISEPELQEGLFELIDQDSNGQIGGDDWSLFGSDNGIFC